MSLSIVRLRVLVGIALSLGGVIPAAVLAQTPAPTGQVERLVAVGDAVAATGRLGLFGVDPIDQDQNVSTIRGAVEDGSLSVADYAGAALLRLGDGAPAVLLDTTRTDPVDGVGLARLLRVETGRSGVSAVLALRADNTRGIYRLERGTLTRLALLTDPVDPAVPVEMVISDTGQVAYVARTAAGAFAVFQTVGNQPTQIFGPGQVVQDAQGRAIDGARVERFRELSSNGAGDLAFHVALPREAGKRPQAVIRKTAQGLSIVAMSGQLVAPGRGAASPLELTGLGRPLIGPDGTIACRGTGDAFVNFFVDGPRRRFEPMLPGVNWNRVETTFDYDVAANGAVALRAAEGIAPESALFLVSPTGVVSVVQRAGERIQPTGRPAFGPDGTESLFFFPARNLDRPLDRHGRVPVVLLRSRLVEGQPAVDAVAAAGSRVPGKPADVQLLSITQRPVVSEQGIAFGALFGGGERFPVPTAGLFSVPLGGTLADATLLAEEGTALPGADRLALFRELAYSTDGTLVFSSLLPGAGSLLATIEGSGSVGANSGPPVAPSPTPSVAPLPVPVARTQSVQAAVAPLLAIGQPLDRPDRRLLAILGRLVSQGSDRQLFVARFSQEGGAPGEGLFSMARDGRIQAIAATGDPAPGAAGARFAGFCDTEAYTVSPPAVAVNGDIVFKARLDRGGTAIFGVFRWSGSTLTNVGLSEPDPDNLALSAEDRPPYDLTRWAAGGTGRAYLMSRHRTRASLQVARLFEHTAAGLTPLVVPGATPILSGASTAPVLTLADLFNTVVNGAGSVFVHGASAGLAGLLAVSPAGLTPVVRQGQPLPPPLDGTSVQGLVFSGSFALLPDSERGALLFRAGVAKPGTADGGRQGLFRLGPQGVETVMVESLEVGGARDLAFGSLAASPDRQTVNGMTAFATFDAKNRRWSLFRWRAGRTTLIAQEGQPLPGVGARVVSMDPGLVLDLPPGSGPVFTLNDAGDVAFLASDGQRWAIYLFTER